MEIEALGPRPDYRFCGVQGGVFEATLRGRFLDGLYEGIMGQMEDEFAAMEAA